MKESYLSVGEGIKQLTDSIWNCVNMLRGSLPAEDFHVSLFLLSAYYDGVLENPKFNDISALKTYTMDSLEMSPNYNQIFTIYQPIINVIPDDTLDELLKEFDRLDKRLLNEHFEIIFDDLLYRLVSVQNNKKAEFLLPQEITNLIFGIAKIPENATIYNPFAGLASFGYNLKGNQSYYGQELINSTWALGMLRLIRKANNNKIIYEQNDSVHNWSTKSDYDLVVANPPLRLKIDNEISREHFGEQQITAEEFVIRNGLRSINSYGQVICIASLGILFSGGSELRMRKMLVDNGLIDSIVSLPAGLLKHTGVPVCILIINKKRSTNDMVRFIDASALTNNPLGQQKKLDFEMVLLAMKEKNDKYIRYVSNQEIKEADYNLNAYRYLIQENHGVLLGDFTSQIKGNRINEERQGKFIRIRNLRDDNFDHIFDADSLEIQEIPKYGRQIEESCLLIAIRWKSIKPTLFQYKGEPIYLSPDIVALKVNDKLVNVHYLINELHSSEVLNQIEAYRVGLTVPTLKVTDLLKIKIDLPSLEEQRGKVKGLVEISGRLKALEEERNALLLGKKIETFDEFASLKHSTGTPRTNILSNAETLLSFFQGNDSEEFREVKKKFLNKYGDNLEEIFTEIRDDINQITTILIKGEKGLMLDKYEKAPIAISKLEEVVKALPAGKFKFKINFESLPAIEVKNRFVEINMTLWKIFLDNFLTNADKYGFKTREHYNEVKFETRVIDDMYELVISNNGIPFKKKYTKEQFITKFNTSNADNGTGIGGYDINRIAEYFGDKNWVLESDESAIYPVRFIFNFPIKTIENGN